MLNALHVFFLVKLRFRELMLLIVIIYLSTIIVLCSVYAVPML